MEDNERNLEKHILNRWRSNKLLQEFARMMVHHDSNGSRVALDEGNEEIQIAGPASAYSFSNVDIMPGGDHKVTGGHVK